MYIHSSIIQKRDPDYTMEGPQLYRGGSPIRNLNYTEEGH